MNAFNVIAVPLECRRDHRDGGPAVERDGHDRGVDGATSGSYSMPLT
jgi:hypothetical protein